MRPAAPGSARFWAKVDRSGGPDACWPWMGYRMKKDYGQVRVAGRLYLAHRFAYEDSVGPIPEGLGVLHRCDNPPCCNPRHFFLGTVADNNADMVSKGRHLVPRALPTGDDHWTRRSPERLGRGEASANAKLTGEQVAGLRARHAEGVSFAKLAAEFGVSRSQAHRIVKGVAWAA